MKCRDVVEGKCTNKTVIGKLSKNGKQIKCNGRYSEEHKYCFCPNKKLKPTRLSQKEIKYDIK